MADFWSNLGDGVAAIAPTIASAFGGPLAGLAVTALEKALGVAPGMSASDPKGFQARLGAALATPEQVLALKQADIAFKEFCSANELQLVRADNEDRDSARRRQVGLRDATPTVLALLVTAGFFGMLATMAFQDLPAANKDMLNVMLGSLGAAWVAVVSYYFGSSAGSRAKDEALVAKLPGVGGA
jgi:hypothetical protein